MKRKSGSSCVLSAEVFLLHPKLGREHTLSLTSKTRQTPQDRDNTKNRNSQLWLCAVIKNIYCDIELRYLLEHIRFANHEIKLLVG
eukprot:m.276856 g.276856  ORF g.276856 m.276856 type:complete len:86 (-) comp16305_c0_seq12:226-483(-)